MPLPVYQSEACILMKLIKDVHATTSAWGIFRWLHPLVYSSRCHLCVGLCPPFRAGESTVDETHVFMKSHFCSLVWRLTVRGPNKIGLKSLIFFGYGQNNVELLLEKIGFSMYFIQFWYWILNQWSSIYIQINISKEGKGWSGLIYFISNLFSCEGKSHSALQSTI